MRSVGIIIFCAATVFAGSLAAGGADKPFLTSLKQNQMIASTVPANGDVNPYGVAIVPRSTGALKAGEILVSNFNDMGNDQGTGTTIVEISPSGGLRVFAQLPSNLAGCPGGVGLTTALVVLHTGWVIVGSLPTSNGNSATAKAGCLIVLNRWGTPVETLAGNGINGPWDMTALDLGNAAVLFVSNVLNGTVAAGGATVNQGTILRIVLAVGDQDRDDDNTRPRELARTVIGSGFPEKTDPNALVIGPTGLGLGPDGTLYVADSVASRIAGIPNALFRGGSAGTGSTVSEGGALNGPLGLAIAPNGDILTVNAGDGNMVETTRSGSQVAVMNVDSTGMGGGTLFGLAVTDHRVYFVNDGNNTLNLLN